jgi:hypothetical protein
MRRYIAGFEGEARKYGVFSDLIGRFNLQIRLSKARRRQYTGTQPPESGGKNTGSNTCFEVRTMAKTQTKQLVVGIDNEGYAVSLEKWKIYIALRDAAAEKHGLLRIVDESGEDYLYPKKSFRPIALPQAVKRAVLAA